MRLHQHEVAVLDEGPARQLFRRAAGMDGGLDPGLLGLEDAILGICGGVPLTLQLLGGQLYEDTGVASWQVMHGPSAACEGASSFEGVQAASSAHGCVDWHRFGIHLIAAA
jgi:hypothetical protein